jgi:putative spermidine/putrescine transport system substrate-binding protein
MKLSRRALTKAALATPFLSKLSGARADVPTLRVATWGGSWRDSIDKNIAPKLKAQGIQIEYVIGNPEDNLAKLIAAKRQGQIPFDVMESKADQTGLLEKAGLMQPLDYAQLPDARAFPDWARGTSLVSTLSAEEGIVYNSDKFKQAGIASPTHYMSLKDDRLQGKLAFPDIGNTAHWNAVVGLAYEGGGNEANLAPALESVNDLRPAYFYSVSTDLATQFGSGEIWAAPWQVGWAVRLKRAGVPISMAYTDLGTHRGAMNLNTIGIVKGSSNSACYAFVDAYLSPEAQAAHCNATGSLPLNATARAALAHDPVAQELMLISDADVGNAFRIDWSQVDPQRWRNQWSRRIEH